MVCNKPSLAPRCKEGLCAPCLLRMLSPLHRGVLFLTATEQIGCIMGIRERWREFWGERCEELEPARRLNLITGYNVRELGGYAVDGGVTTYRRFIRSGGLEMLSIQDQRRLHDYGVRLVLDLRGDYEVEVARDKLTQMSDVRYMHVPLFDLDLSDPALGPDEQQTSYRTLGYLTMLANHDAVRRIFSFFATARPDECVLFHCAAGMDRTGVTALLLLGLAGASRERIVADYLYSFDSERAVDRVVFEQRKPQRREVELRLEAIEAVLDRVVQGYGTYERYLLECGVTTDELDRVREHLLS